MEHLEHTGGNETCHLRVPTRLKYLFGHLDVSVVQPLCELLKVLTHSEGDGVVPKGAAGFDDALVPLLLNYFPHLQLQSNLSQARANTWRVIGDMSNAGKKIIKKKEGGEEEGGSP